MRILFASYLTTVSWLSIVANDSDLSSTSASSLHKMGIDAAVAGNYDMSLAYLRAAVRSDPRVPIYFNDLGVTEMRVGQYTRANRRFLKALELDKTLQLAISNLDELKRFMSPEEFQPDIKDFPQLHRLKSPRNISANEFMNIQFETKAEINEAFKTLREPLVIRNAMAQWGWKAEEFALDKMISLYGDSKCDYYPHNMVEESVKPFFATMTESISHLVRPRGVYPGVDASEPGTYIQWNMPPYIWNELFKIADAVVPPLLDDGFWRRECFTSFQQDASFHVNTHWKMFLIGEKGSGMFNHKDTLRTASWQVQIQGSKKWHLCSSSQDEFMYKPGEVDMFNPDYDRFPKVRNASCYQVVLEAGDAIFYPNDYWHQTLNLDTPTVAVTGTIVTPECHSLVTEELRKECGGSARIFIADPQLCEQLNECFSFWHGVFDPEIPTEPPSPPDLELHQVKEEGVPAPSDEGGESADTRPPRERRIKRSRKNNKSNSAKGTSSTADATGSTSTSKMKTQNGEFQSAPSGQQQAAHTTPPTLVFSAAAGSADEEL